ncbi:endolytic transglycosylase MltG [Thermopolyspora sp. NPDC052614]|uniref:endolytic transglycosylase MltG n=1 Tax=Thermopolyspora sp. NPDC052614 TaxID=3155682 RepID=UPI0034198E6A
MNDLDMDALLGSEDDDGSYRRRASGPSRSARSRSRRRRRRNRRKGFAASVFAIVIVLGILGGGGYYGYRWLNDVLVPDDYTGRGSGEVTIEIKEGQSATEIAQTLVEEDVVKSARAFTDAASAAGKIGSLQPGVYKLRKQMAAEYAVEALDPKHRLRTTITIPEGLRLSQVLERLATATGRPVEEFERAAKRRKDIGLPSYAKALEGYAFPATYEIPPNKTPKDILTDMVGRFEVAAEKADLVEGAKERGLTPNQVITLASIVQAESGKKSDMAKIARVLYNRLNRTPPMMLQMDSAVLYGVGKFGLHASAADRASDSPYNTYRRLGLPPGPICNPGDDAIEAALNPAKGNWLFFVTTDPKNKITKFAETQAEHDRNVAEYNRNRAGG